MGNSLDFPKTGFCIFRKCLRKSCLVWLAKFSKKSPVSKCIILVRMEAPWGPHNFWQWKTPSANLESLLDIQVSKVRVPYPESSKSSPSEFVFQIHEKISTLIDGLEDFSTLGPSLKVKAAWNWMVDKSVLFPFGGEPVQSARFQAGKVSGSFLSYTRYTLSASLWMC